MVWVQGVLDAIGPLDKFMKVEKPEMLVSSIFYLEEKLRVEVFWGPGDPIEAFVVP